MRSAGLARMGCSAVALLGVAALPATAGAATFTVTKLTDTADGACDADCSLREAVIAANAAGGADVVALPAGTLNLSIPGQSEQAAATGDLDIVAAGGTITVRGTGVAATIVDANAIDRAFQVLPGARLELADLTVTDGTGNGSAVLVGTSGGPGASLDMTRAAATLHRDGGPAVYADEDAAVTVSDSAFRDNGADPASVESTFGGAGLYLNDASTATVTRTAFTGNRVSFGGGGIYVNNGARLTLSQGTFTANTSNFGGGALWTQNDTTSTVADSTFSGNSAGFGGGAVWNQNDAVLAITGSTLSGNSTPANSNGGGAIYNQNDAKLTITASTIAGNTASSILGGGGIFTQNAATLDVISSTISGNRHVAGGGGGADRGGGAIYAQNLSVTTLVNTTVSGNETTVNGGAFAMRNQPVIRATNVTIAGNTAAGTGGVLYNGTVPAPGVPSFELANTIAAGNLAAGLPGGCAGTAPPGSVVSLGTNVEPTATCGTPAAGDSTADPQLGPLAANGGPTLTHAIAPTSPAKDTANAARCPATDQRGIARPQFAGCDIGAFELAPAPPAPAPPAAAPPPPPAAKPAAVAFASFVKLPSTKKCVSRRSFRIRLRVPKGVVVSSAEIRLNGKRVKAIKRSRFTAPVDLRNLPKGRVKVNIRIRLADGRTISGTRTYRTCAVKRKGSGKPRV